MNTSPIGEALGRDFGAQALEGGYDYYCSRRVLEYQLDDGLLEASVRGRTTYVVQIELPGLVIGDQRIAMQSIVSECTCSVVVQCKHAVAAVLTWAAGLGVSCERAFSAHGIVLTGDQKRLPRFEPTPRFDVGELHDAPWRGSSYASTMWLRDVRDRPVKTEKPQAPAEHQLAYVLTEHELINTVIVQYVATRVLKSGRLGIFKRFKGPSEIVGRVLPYVTADDLAIVEAMNRRDRQGIYDHGIYTGVVVSGDLLDAMVATGRAHLGSIQGPVFRSGGVREATWAWSHGEQNQVRIELQHAGNAKTLSTNPVRYIDGIVIGPVSVGDCDPDFVAQLVRMPWMHMAQVGVVAPILTAEGIDLPVPEMGPKEEPCCELHVRQAEVQWSGRQGHGRRKASVLAVKFRYDDVSCGESGSAILDVDGQPFVRNERYEHHRLTELDRLGLSVWTSNPRQTRSVNLVSSVPLRVPDFVDREPLDGPALISPAVYAALIGSGWIIKGIDLPNVRVVPLAMVDLNVEQNGSQDWFEVHAGIEIDGQRIDLVPVLTPLLKGGRKAWENMPRAIDSTTEILVALGDTRVLRVPLALLETLHDQLIELFDRPEGPGGGWTIDAARADMIDTLELLKPRWMGEDRLRALAKQMRSCLAPEPVAVPVDLKADLRPYQRDGLAWLHHLFGLGLGGILADDMGLGKTVQALAHVVQLRALATLSDLVVCPASMVGVWASEAAKFAPTLRVAVLHGVGRQSALTVDADLVITSHATLARDADIYAQREWQVVICDEAQALKNRATKLYDAMRELNAKQRLCLSGTPMENHLGELHALLSWAVPGALGSAAAFQRIFREPIELNGDRTRSDLLRRRVAPFLLRRTKQAVATELPERIDIDVPIELGAKQRQLYETIRLAMDERVRAAVAERGLARSGMQVIEALLRLRQAACDPRLIPTDLAKKCTESAKVEYVRELVTTLIAEGRPTLIFSQFTSLLDIIEDEVMKPLAARYLRLDGTSRNRSTLVKDFQNGKADVFLLSLKAGGTGLTLTHADTVILLDPWWNPAVERQAADRAHRIGQTRTVTIYRLIAMGTVEERIRQLQAKKVALADALMDESGQALGRLTLDDIDALMSPVEG